MKKLIVMLLIFSTITSTNLIAQTWNGSLSNDWNTAGNWTPGNVPTGSADVIIDNAAASYQPVLTDNVSIASLTMSAGILNLNNYTINCSGIVELTGDSMCNGKVRSNFLRNVANMHFGGKFILEETGAHVETWSGNNKFYGDSLIILWAGSSLELEHATFSPDSIFGNLKVQYTKNGWVAFAVGSPLYVQKDLILDNSGNGTFFMDSPNAKFIGGNFVAQNFSKSYAILKFENVSTLGSGPIGPFYCYAGAVNNCNFNGNFSLVADSNANYNYQLMEIHNSSLLGDDNFFEATNLDIQNCKFGKTGVGNTIFRAIHWIQDGNNKFFGNVQWGTYTVPPRFGLIIRQTLYGQDTCLGNMNFILKGDASLSSNLHGHSYVAGNLIIDGQGGRKYVGFSGDSGTSFTVAGNLTIKNFTNAGEPWSLGLHNLNVAGTDTIGIFYCGSASITNSSFNGNLKVITDPYDLTLNHSFFLGADNFFQAGKFDIQNCKFGKTGTGTTILRVASLYPTNSFMRDGNNKFFGDVEWQAFAPSNGSILMQQTFYGADTCLGNMAVNLVGPSSANLAGNNLYIGKGLSLQNNGSGVIVHDNASSAIHFIGADTANYSFGGTGSAPSILNIEMNRKGGLRLLSPLACSGTLTFTRGIILSSSLNPLNIPNNATVSSAWDSSYLDGPIIKTGDTEFTFPLGKNNVYAPLTITAPSVASDAFSAQYFNINPGIVYDSTQHDVSLYHISRSEYWLLNRTNGTATPKVTLSWNANRSGPVNVMEDLRIARWDGNAWKDEGNGNISGTNEAGTIQSLNNISNFSPFTLASSSVNNVLPVNFILFKVTLNATNTILLQWKTSGEINVESYNVERSMNGRNWIKIATVFPAPSHIYDYADNALVAGLYYYRIKQVDTDGSYRFSIIRVIKLNGDTRLSIWPNPVTNNLFIQSNFAKGTFEITDVSGKIIRRDYINNILTTIPLQHLVRGVYTIRAYYDGKMFVEKFIKQ